jgi:hypothetical protein
LQILTVFFLAASLSNRLYVRVLRSSLSSPLVFVASSDGYLLSLAGGSDTIPNAKLIQSADKCQWTCNDDKSQYCGGQGSLDVYFTRQTTKVRFFFLMLRRSAAPGEFSEGAERRKHDNN